jgi:hypothetical protein
MLVTLVDNIDNIENVKTKVEGPLLSFCCLPKVYSTGSKNWGGRQGPNLLAWTPQLIDE